MNPNIPKEKISSALFTLYETAQATLLLDLPADHPRKLDALEAIRILDDLNGSPLPRWPQLQSLNLPVGSKPDSKADKQ